MPGDWTQDLATFVLVGGACLYVGRRIWLVFHPEAGASSGCGSGGCGSCPSNAASGAKAPIQVVTIGMPGPGPGKRV
jgi:hypothetical protein